MRQVRRARTSIANHLPQRQIHRVIRRARPGFTHFVVCSGCIPPLVAYAASPVPPTAYSHADTAPEPFTLDGLTQLLRSKGLRITGNRRAILQVLLKAKEPLGLDQIQTRGGAATSTAATRPTLRRSSA